MRTLAAIGALVITSAAAFAGSPETVVLDVQNMTCPVCPITVRKSLQKVDGVVDAKVDLDHHTATVKFDPEKADIATLVKATTNAGYPATVRK